MQSGLRALAGYVMMSWRIMEIDVLIDEDFAACPEASWLRRVAEQVIIAEKTGRDVELSVVITTQERVQELNRVYRGKDEPTDVLAFYMTPEAKETGAEPAFFARPPDGTLHLGEVIISYPQAVTQAGERQHSVKKEIAILLVHGVLHLLGYDHNEPEAESRMKASEDEILSRLEGEL